MGASLEFTFVGTRLRLIAGTTPTQAKEIRVFIDGNLETYNPYNTTDIRQILVYEKTGLSNTLHTVKLDSVVAGNWGMDAIDIDSDGRLITTVGSQIPTPDEGWKRYDDNNASFKYVGSNWIHESNTSANNYNKTDSYTTDSVGGHSFKFKFYGSKIRVVQASFHREDFFPDDVKIIIDGVQETFSKKDPISSSIVANRQMLLYEKTGLDREIHTVEILSGSNGIYRIQNDAIDIDLDGRLFHPDEVTNIAELEVGKRIRCNYQASTSGTIGTFSGIGKESSSFIPTSGSIATPNRDFYFIAVEDWNGDFKLIADRNVQNLISWDALNSEGFINGVNVYSTLIPQLTSDIHAEGNAFASSVYSGEYLYSAWKVFDRDKKTGVYNSRWSTTGTSGYIGFNFTEGNVVNGYSLMTLSSGSSNWITAMPKDWTFEGSEDTTNGSDGTWIVLDTRTSQTNWISLNYNRYFFENSNKYKAYRLKFTSNNGDASYSGLFEMEMYDTSQISMQARLLTGGINATDKDNEWDKYIVNSTLNGTIIAGDNNVWNYSGGASWTSTTNTAGSANRTGRGASGNAGASGYNPTSYVAAATATGFRPFMKIENLSMNRSFINHEGSYKKLKKGSPKVNETLIITPSMTSNTTPSGVASASSIYNASYEAWRAFNGGATGTEDCWASSAGNPSGFLVYNFNNVTTLNAYAITSRDASDLTSAPKDWTLAGSNDGTNWSTIHTVTNSTGWSQKETRSFVLSRDFSFSNYRLIIHTNNGANYTTIGELKLVNKIFIPAIPSEWITISATLPSESTFINDGMDDLSVFNRKNEDFVQTMSANGSLGSGRLFKGSIDLKKYIEITNVSVK
ncbi:hypothetical protein C0Q44_13510 [Paenibacillus sp. PCH8]|uniref:discoidin domain-containing protein n=1 Tax=Paenibacillus sp. PCH8 TaxID=2066524 RepID=UPI000CF92004|nr:discoidin domain-containing protein [Paenibacillus sp. PCH8]PQP82455.1 hypothetical protein C0Q44_13510 [Paenibacillus sp. PCH8]